MKFPLHMHRDLDMKFWANLWVDTWNDPYLESGPPGGKVINYTVPANSYGKFTDPYLINAGKKNWLVNAQA